MDRRTSVASVLVTLIVTLSGLQLSAQSPDDAEKPRPPSPLRRLMDASLEWYEIKSPPSDKPMTVRVALRWANNTRGSENGMTVLYLDNGIPLAVCNVYPWEQHLHHEFDSVSRGKLLCESGGQPIWSPDAVGVEFQPVPDADAPADSPVARLRQMKSLAGDFASTMLGWKSDKSDREALRMLPQPLYRYESSTTSSRFDGAVFAFVQGTDPESLLLLEAVRRNGMERWEYAFVRQTSGELEGRYRGTVVCIRTRTPPRINRAAFTSLIPLPCLSMCSKV